MKLINAIARFFRNIGYLVGHDMRDVDRDNVGRDQTSDHLRQMIKELYHEISGLSERLEEHCHEAALKHAALNAIIEAFKAKMKAETGGMIDLQHQYSDNMLAQHKNLMAEAQSTTQKILGRLETKLGRKVTQHTEQIRKLNLAKGNAPDLKALLNQYEAVRACTVKIVESLRDAARRISTLDAKNRLGKCLEIMKAQGLVDLVDENITDAITLLGTLDDEMPDISVKCHNCDERFMSSEATYCHGDHVEGFKGATMICPHCQQCDCSRFGAWKEEGKADSAILM